MKIAIATEAGTAPASTPSSAPSPRHPPKAAGKPWVADEIGKRSGKEARSCVLGHLQRGGSPTPMDRVLCSTFGAHAVELIASDRLGRMVAWQGSQIGDIPLADAVGRLKTVPLGSNLVRTARALGISLCDGS